MNEVVNSNPKCLQKLSGKFSYATLTILFFCYVAIRTIYVGATIDEITTIQGANDLSYLDIMVEAHPTANNHIVNTLLIKFLFSIGTNSVELARLPNLFSFILYLYFGYRITSTYLHPVVGIGCFTLLMCNPFLLDFFGLARGYGMSLAFMMGSLYFGGKSFESRSTWYLIKSLLFASLSVFSIFSMIYFFMGLIITINLILFLIKDFSFLKRSLVCCTLMGVGLLSSLTFPIFRLVKTDALAYGGSNSFYSDTLLSLARYSLYSTEITPSIYLSLNLFLGLLSLTALLSYHHLINISSLKSLFLGVTIASILLIVLAHHLAGVLYPLSRVGLFLYPLFIFSLCFCLNEVKNPLGITILILTLIPFIINFASKGNFYRTSIWSFDSNTEKILNRINESGRSEGKVLIFACTPVIYHSVNYYIEKNDYSFIRVVQDENQPVPAGVDYYLLSKRDTASLSEAEYIKRWVRPLDSYEKDIFLDYPKDDLVVFSNLRYKPEPTSHS